VPVLEIRGHHIKQAYRKSGSHVPGIPAKEDERLTPLPYFVQSCVLLPVRLVFRTLLAIYSPSLTNWHVTLS